LTFRHALTPHVAPALCWHSAPFGWKHCHPQNVPPIWTRPPSPQIVRQNPIIFHLQSGGNSITTACRLGHHRLRDRKLLGRFHRAAGAHNGEQDLQLQFVSVVDAQPRFLRMHFPFFVTPLDLPCQPMHPISFLVELGELKSASEKASGRLIVSGPPLNSGSALRSAALSWLIGAAALA
jgi:hypothetical protein